MYVGIMKSICVEAGMDFFTIKPFVLEDILAIYRQHQMNLFIVVFVQRKN